MVRPQTDAERAQVEAELHSSDAFVLRRRHHARASLRRNHSPRTEAAGGGREASQALDHEPRPGVRPKKSQRDRLIRLAQTQPEWVLGFADEAWCSRCA